MEIVKSNIANALTSAAKDHVLGVANDIYDESQEKYQSEINKELLDNANSNNTDINEFHEIVDKIIDILYIIDAPNNLEKLESIKITLNTLGDGYKNVVELATTLKSFITDTDATNETINSWKEIENFLQGITDTESLTGLLEELKTGVDNKIAEINNKLAEYKVKDVDGVSIIVDENGIVKLNYSDDYIGLPTNQIVTGSPIQTRLINNEGLIKSDIKFYTYDGNRQLYDKSKSIVLENGLAKHITELKEIIPNLKIFDIEFGDGDYQYVFDYLAEDAENFKNVVFKLYATNNTYLLTIYQYHHNTNRIETNTYTHPINGIYNIIITPTNVTGQRILITDNFFNPTTINANILKGETLSESKFDYNLKTKFNNINQATINNAEAIEVLTTTVNNNSNVINTFLGELNNDNLTDNNYKNLLNLLGITADAETVSSLITKFNALGSEYSTIYKVAKTLHDFLNDIDTSDITINRWTEIKNFLNGITDDKDLLGIINDSISNNNKNYYTKEEIDNAIKPFVDNGFKVMEFETGSNKNCQELFNLYNEDNDNIKRVIAVIKHPTPDKAKNRYYISNLLSHDAENNLLYTCAYIASYTIDCIAQNIFRFRITATNCYVDTLRLNANNTLYINSVGLDKLNPTIQEKINAIPDIKIFDVSGDNTEFHDYVAEHGKSNVMVIVNDRLLTLHTNTDTETFIGLDNTLIFYTIKANGFQRGNRYVNDATIKPNTIHLNRLTTDVQDKINNIPDIKIFDIILNNNSTNVLPIDATELIEYCENNPINNVYIKIYNEKSSLNGQLIPVRNYNNGVVTTCTFCHNNYNAGAILYIYYEITANQAVERYVNNRVITTNIDNKAVTYEKLSDYVKEKLDSIPNLKIFTLGNDNTELIDYINTNGCNNVLIHVIIVDNHYLLNLLNNNTTETFISNNTAISYITFNTTGYSINKGHINGTCISDNSITEDKLATTAVATAEQLQTILNTL
ncbi:MAG: hypothetical protein KNU04_gp30 [crAssphage sp. isolate ctbg_1]|uniref:Uncharacterized protein n=1 Tax=crAssphage sp. isolate ctbg_1 TaxID=2989854 RepID=A0A345MSZ7_9CAUD|nr:MAG: hypothetical protein KNU04_gp30 [crAssphage sp. isolate ctbg_1]AXH74497.1 MAG: hypothetical protein [crAssphage sp. isolate ctbg_1]